MSPTYSVGKQGRRYAYYVSQALLQNEKERAGSLARVPAEEIERLVRKWLESTNDGSGLSDDALWKRVERVVVRADRVEIVTTEDAVANVEEAPAS